MNYKLFILLLTIVFPAALFSQNAESKLKEVQKKFESVNNISASFKQEINGKAGLSGKFYFKKENKLRLELKKLIIISDGKTIWNYNKPEDKVIINHYDDSDPSILSLRNFIYVYPSKCSIKESNEDGENVITFTPEDEKLNFKTAKIWLATNNLIKKIQVKLSSGETLKITFSNLKINSNLADSKFSFTTPEGCKVIDLR